MRTATIEAHPFVRMTLGALLALAWLFNPHSPNLTEARTTKTGLNFDCPYSNGSLLRITFEFRLEEGVEAPNPDGIWKNCYSDTAGDGIALNLLCGATLIEVSFTKLKTARSAELTVRTLCLASGEDTKDIRIGKSHRRGYQWEIMVQGRYVTTSWRYFTQEQLPS